MLEDGSEYTGQWDANGRRCGRGKQQFAEGDLYEGYWKDGKACGKGRLIKRNGDIYVGEFMDNKAHGVG